MAGESADICSIHNKEEFNWKLQQHVLAKLSSVMY
jgi:hypothetical protein